MNKALPAADEDDFHFRSWPFYWLARATGRYLQNMEEALRPLGLDIPRWRVLMVLHDEGCASVSEIADHAISKLSTMTKIVQRMQIDGLVTCSPRASDARVTEVTLTKAGEAAGEKAWLVADRIYAQAFRGTRKSDVVALTKLLQKLTEQLGEPG